MYKETNLAWKMRLGSKNWKKASPLSPAAISDTPFIFCRIQNHLPHWLPGKQLSCILKSHMLKAYSGELFPADDRKYDSEYEILHSRS